MIRNHLLSEDLFNDSFEGYLIEFKLLVPVTSKALLDQLTLLPYYQIEIFECVYRLISLVDLCNYHFGQLFKVSYHTVLLLERLIRIINLFFLLLNTWIVVSPASYPSVRGALIGGGTH